MGSVGPMGKEGLGGSGRLWPEVVNLDGRSRDGLNGRKLEGTTLKLVKIGGDWICRDNKTHQRRSV